MAKKEQTPTLFQLREAILEALTHAGPDYMKSNELSKRLGIRATDPAYEMVREALEQLEDEGLIFRTSRRRYGRTVPNVIIEGRLQNSRSGWRVIPDENPEDALEIDPRNLWTAFHGDRVRAKLLANPYPGELPRGEVTRVVERSNSTVVGTVKRGRAFYLDPDDRLIHRTITINRKDLAGAKVGDKAVVKLFEWDDPYDDPEGRVVEILGRAGEMNAEIAAIAAAHRLPHLFPKDVLNEAEAIPSTFSSEDMHRRRDLRDMTIFTIDPVDARDFDDAISIEEHEGGEVTLGIHIADVSHYVREGTALDREAEKRGTSVYLVTGVIPMLPERLSNDLCSLRPNEDRLAYSVFVRLSPRGAIKGYEITKSIINSKRRFTYEEALEVLETGKGDFAHELLAINKMAHVLRANRHRKGSVDFDRAEMKFVLDERNHPVEVIQKHATESTRLIEDCMLLANRVVAEHIGKTRSEKRGGARNPFIYRIHDVPPKEKLNELSRFVKSLGYTLPVDNIQPKDIQRLIDQAKGTDEEELVTEMTLRSMAKAVYSEFNIGHFGLAFQHYTHFTSPIRRYPDLIVHRMLDEYAQGMSNERRNQYAGSLGAIADHCSERERAAVEAERDSLKIAQVEFLKDHVGDVFEATVAGVMPFGLFAELKRFGIEGLVRLKNIQDDYYVFDERSKSFKGRHSKKVYRLGDSIHVRVIRVDEINTQIDMELIEEEEYRAEVDEPGSEAQQGGHGGSTKRASQAKRGAGKRTSGARSSNGRAAHEESGGADKTRGKKKQEPVPFYEEIRSSRRGKKSAPRKKSAKKGRRR